MYAQDLNTKFKLGDCLCGAAKLNKNADPDKYGYCGYGTGFEFSLSSGEWGKNVVILGVHNSLSVHVANRKKKVS